MRVVDREKKGEWWRGWDGGEDMGVVGRGDGYRGEDLGSGRERGETGEDLGSGRERGGRQVEI